MFTICVNTDCMQRYKIRITMPKQTGFSKVTNDEVRTVIEENIFQLS